MRSNKISASIEMLPKHVLDTECLVGIAPPLTRIYITHAGTETTDTLVAAAKKITDAGYRAVPHFAARRLTSKKALETRIKRMTQEAGVEGSLIIGRGLQKPDGDFTSTNDVLETSF